MLRKEKQGDGGMETINALIGPAVFLDVWAVRNLSADTASELRNRFSNALLARQGSLLVSSVWLAELDTITGDARSRAESMFTSLGSRWLLINPIVSVVAARQAVNDLGASLSQLALRGYVLERCGELLRAGIDPHTLSDDAFFDLGRTLAWPRVVDALKTKPDDRSDKLKAIAMIRANQDRDKQRQDRSSADVLYPAIDFFTNRIVCAHNAVWREVTRQSLGRTWMANDGFDIAHVVPAMAIGGFLAVDTAWQQIALRASTDLPKDHVRLYRPGELDRLVSDLENSGIS